MRWKAELLNEQESKETSDDSEEGEFAAAAAAAADPQTQTFSNADITLIPKIRLDRSSQFWGPRGRVIAAFRAISPPQFGGDSWSRRKGPLRPKREAKGSFPRRDA